MVHAVIRSPLLSDMYSKQDRKVMTQKQVAQANQEAFKTLCKNGIDQANPQIFINKLNDSVSSLIRLESRGLHHPGDQQSKLENHAAS